MATTSPAWTATPSATGEPGLATAEGLRLALVIGNGHYADAPLANPTNDARAIAAALEASGFRVVLKLNAPLREMQAAVRDFGDSLKSSGRQSTGLFYFAGHGMQIKGRNYLIPVGAEIQREDEVAYHALDAQAVLDKMESAGNSTNLLVLDACRNNPFARSFRSQQQGLAQMEAPVGTLVAFATAPGSVSSDGVGSNGLYTEHLLRAMRTPGLKVEDVFKQVRAAVRRESQGRQIPWESTSLEGDFYFLTPIRPGGALAAALQPEGAASAAAPAKPPTPAEATPLPSPEAELDDAMWQAVSRASQAGPLEAYLRRFPSGQHAQEALRRMLHLRAVEQERSAVAPPPALNPFGYGVGDRWQYQVREGWTQRQLGEYEIVVTAVQPDGSLQGQDKAELHRQGHLRALGAIPGRPAQRYSPYRPIWHELAQTVPNQRLRYSLTEGEADQAILYAVDAELRVAGQESVQVPAGTFMAYRVDLREWVTASRGHERWQEYWLTTHWYSPEVGAPVASEYSRRDQAGNTFKWRQREDLVQYRRVHDGTGSASQTAAESHADATN
ncbi:caspase family protein [Ideonella livida]|uniref:Caspase family protein n=1 Tax=Ideonella livida TaxID=2707176 RepID=A0A7C9TL35_9BURK|nr:caspase family protein [Ideonella livida]NDY92958.1 caspase family protein [Ideonella livida]